MEPPGSFLTVIRRGILDLVKDPAGKVALTLVANE